MPKWRNPTNLPQCRPIEDLWGTLTGLVYEGGWTAKIFQKLKNRITRCVKKIDSDGVQRSFSSIREKMRAVYCRVTRTLTSLTARVNGQLRNQVNRLIK